MNSKDKRKAVKALDGSYQLLKPKEGTDGSWHAYGQRVSIKGLYDRVARGDLIQVDPEVQETLESYHKAKIQREKRWREKSRTLADAV
ncbi:MAG: hypothetical protein ACE5ES_02075 [Candidatus Nanoarchaeia archaeon]